jgi:hypothetical protein
MPEEPKFKDDGITIWNDTFMVDTICINEWMASAYSRGFLGLP